MKNGAPSVIFFEPFARPLWAIIRPPGASQPANEDVNNPIAAPTNFPKRKCKSRRKAHGYSRKCKSCDHEPNKISTRYRKPNRRTKLNYKDIDEENTGRIVRPALMQQSLAHPLQTIADGLYYCPEADVHRNAGRFHLTHDQIGWASNVARQWSARSFSFAVSK